MSDKIMPITVTEGVTGRSIGTAEIPWYKKSYLTQRHTSITCQHVPNLLGTTTDWLHEKQKKDNKLHVLQQVSRSSDQHQLPVFSAPLKAELTILKKS